MFQLIIIVFTIALVAMLATASINYLPVWNKEATDLGRRFVSEVWVCPSKLSRHLVN
jgi:hypothetical protein